MKIKFSERVKMDVCYNWLDCIYIEFKLLDRDYFYCEYFDHKKETKLSAFKKIKQNLKKFIKKIKTNYLMDYRESLGA